MKIADTPFNLNTYDKGQVLENMIGEVLDDVGEQLPLVIVEGCGLIVIPCLIRYPDCFAGLAIAVTPLYTAVL